MCNHYCMCHDKVMERDGIIGFSFAIMCLYIVTGGVRRPKGMKLLHSLLFSPQTHNWSKTVIRDSPLLLRLYSTFGGFGDILFG